MTHVSDAAAFAAALYRDQVSGALGWYCTFRGDPRKAGPRDWCGRALPVGARIFTPDDANNYIVVSTFTERHRRKTCFAALHAVMVDDIGTKITPAKIKLPVSAAVETSKANWQGWYFLAEPVADRALAERLIDRMIDVGLAACSDPGMSGVTRYGRLPVGVNGKHTPAFPCRLALLEPGRRYTVEEIAGAYGLDLSAPPPRPAPKVRAMRGDELDALALLHAAGLHRADRGGGAHEILCPWVNEHTDRAETGTAYFEPSSENNQHGGFRCHHGHCAGRTISDLYRWLRALLRIARRAA